MRLTAGTEPLPFSLLQKGSCGIVGEVDNDCLHRSYGYFSQSVT